MKVSELIEELQKLPPHSTVMIAYDMNIRMEVDVVKPAKYHDDGKGEQVVVMTDQQEWDWREHWG
jgi:hypothetical protein